MKISLKLFPFIGVISTVALICLFIKFKRNTVVSALFSFAVIGIFGFAAFFYSYPRTSNAPALENITHQGGSSKTMAFIKIEKDVLIDAPVIKQFPELPRGCEVTTLAMLLESAGVKADKMKLAEEIKKDPTPRTIKNGDIHFGNPHRGFVGDMYTFSKPGLGVYNEPIMELAETYLPGKMVNLTGQAFEELKIPLSDGRPVWVIINSQYRELEDSYFQTWQTSSGKIRITMKEHSVLITGYNQDYVYFNDPLTGIKNKKAPITDFEKSWVQMGSQAITYYFD